MDNRDWKNKKSLVDYHIIMGKIWSYEKNIKSKLGFLLNEEIMSLAIEVTSGRIHDWQPKPPARKSLLGVHAYLRPFLSPKW